MKKLMRIVSVIIVAGMAVIAGQTDFTKKEGVFPGGEAPGEVATPFAPGLISANKSNEWGLAVNRDWTEIFFSRSEKDMASIYRMKRADTSWSKSVVAEFSGTYNDSHPVFAKKDQGLFFVSKRPCKGARFEMNLWFVEKRGEAWSGSPRSMGAPFISQTVHAAYPSPAGDIYASGLVVFIKDGNRYLPRSKLQPDIAGRHPAISPDGSYLIFSKFDREGFGGNDLYIVFRKDSGGWTLPRNLGGNVNSGSVESSPTISGDGKFIFFSRKGDIWWVSAAIVEKWRPKN